MEKQLSKIIQIPGDSEMLNDFFDSYEKLKLEAQRKVLISDISDSDMKRAGLLDSANSLFKLDPNLAAPLK